MRWPMCGAPTPDAKYRADIDRILAAIERLPPDTARLILDAIEAGKDEA